MNLTLIRKPSTKNCTIGSLYIDGKFECYTLEDVVREVYGIPVEKWKIAGSTAIPRGIYKVKITPSYRFHRDLPQLLDVPGFSGVRMHAGNTDKDTEGCILLGDVQFGTYIGASRIATERVIKKIAAAKDIVTIAIS